MKYAIGANVNCQLAPPRGHTVARQPINLVLNPPLDKAVAPLPRKHISEATVSRLPGCSDIAVTCERN